MDLDMAVDLICTELEQASEKFPPFNSNHEGWAVITEELAELWYEIRTHPGGPFSCNERIEREAVQVAAMALRFLIDRCPQSARR